MTQKALDYLFRQLKDHKIALGHAEKRGDKDAVENLKVKIECVEYLIDLATKEL